MSLKLQIDQLASDAVSRSGLKLQLGCGHNILEGWLNTDSMPSPFCDYLDFTRPFPFMEGTFIAVFCEHTIEHVARADHERMVGEIYRVLRPGGMFRVVTPSLENFCRMALAPDSAVTRTYLAWFRNYTKHPEAEIGDAMNLCFYGHGHRHIFSTTLLSALLRKAGFTDIRVMSAGTYGNAVFDGVDGHGKVIGADINAIEAMAMEASKPSG